MDATVKQHLANQDLDIEDEELQIAFAISVEEDSNQYKAGSQ